MQRISVIALITLGMVTAASAQVDVYAGQSDGTGNYNDIGWLAYMNVFNLPADGGAYQFGGAWGIGDLVTEFDDGAATMTMLPNRIDDNDPYWYIGGGAAGAPGNKIMEANTYVDLGVGALPATTLNFNFDILADTRTPDYEAWVFIKEFNPGYAGVLAETRIKLEDLPGGSVGSHTISLAVSGAPDTPVQYGFQFIGANVHMDTPDPVDSVVIGTVPEPASLTLLALAGLLIRRR
jgi:hypothetical protein